MWFHFKTTKTYYIVFITVIFVSNIFKTHQFENVNPMQSMESFLEDLNVRNKGYQKINKSVSEQYDVYKKNQSIPSNVVLMMKLISYYEDKFKVANHEPTEGDTTSFSVRIEKENNNGNRVIQRVGFKPKELKTEKTVDKSAGTANVLYIKRYNNNVIPEVIIA